MSEELPLIRIKMLCNWQSSKQLCDEWSNMCETGYRWKNFEITWEDENIDYYVIINSAQELDYFVKQKTIIFQMEPSCAVFCWDPKWREPSKKFLFVGKHSTSLNNVQLQLKNIRPVIPEQREDKAIAILSQKLIDPGHYLRRQFIKHLERRNRFLIDVYGRENYHRFRNYKGKILDDAKEDYFIKYKYCFQAENNSEFNYATEKIWEPIVCECLCFYWGCPNLETYVDPLCFVRLNLEDFEGSMQIIQTAIRENWWAQRIDVIRREKEKILNELSFFPRLKQIIDNAQK